MRSVHHEDLPVPNVSMVPPLRSVQKVEDWGRSKVQGQIRRGDSQVSRILETSKRSRKPRMIHRGAAKDEKWAGSVAVSLNEIFVVAQSRYPFASFAALVSAGTISNKSPTTPR